MGPDWFYINWAIDFPKAISWHINEKETLAVVMVAARWGPCWTNKRIFLYSDNSATVHCINKGPSRNKTLMTALRHLFWLSAIFNFHITAHHN